MGFAIIGLGIGLFFCKLLWKLNDAFATCILTFFVTLGLIFNFCIPLRYGNQTILETKELMPFPRDENTYVYVRISGKVDIKYDDFIINSVQTIPYQNIRVTNALVRQFNYCKEFPMKTWMSYPIFCAPRYYYEVLAPAENIKYQ